MGSYIFHKIVHYLPESKRVLSAIEWRSR